MQKVEGSSPFIRFARKARISGPCPKVDRRTVVAEPIRATGPCYDSGPRSIAFQLVARPRITVGSSE
jgi:hypothetical protein